jgi:hypothetical protein
MLSAVAKIRTSAEEYDGSSGDANAAYFYPRGWEE